MDWRLYTLTCNTTDWVRLKPRPDAEAAWDEQIQSIANATLYPETDSWYLGANIPGKPRQFLGHLKGSQYFDQLATVAEEGYAGFVFEKVS